MEFELLGKASNIYCCLYSYLVFCHILVWGSHCTLPFGHLYVSRTTISCAEVVFPQMSFHFSFKIRLFSHFIFLSQVTIIYFFSYYIIYLHKCHYFLILVLHYNLHERWDTDGLTTAFLKVKVCLAHVRPSKQQKGPEAKGFIFTYLLYFIWKDWNLQKTFLSSYWLKLCHLFIFGAIT